MNREGVEVAVDWEDFLGRHDLHWKRMPTVWNEAPFLGNGMMGVMIWQTDDRTVRWNVGRGDVQDHRPDYRSAFIMHNACRLPIGYFELKTAGVIKGGTIRLDLWNAEATGEILTTGGSIKWQSLVLSGNMAMLVIVEPSEGERECKWEWKALPAISPRQSLGNKKLEMADYIPNGPSREEAKGDVNLCIQPLLCGWETATAWIEKRRDGRIILTASVAHSFPESTAQQGATEVVNRISSTPLEPLLAAHRDWWHAYYPASFLTLSDAEWESFYWIQMYKLASATRSDGMLIDNQGPWLQPTPWPGTWWNLNVQMTYWSTYDSNRLELGESLTRTIYKHIENLINNVPEQFRADSAGLARVTGQDCRADVDAPDGKNCPETGVLLWTCHNLWLHYRHSMDDKTLRENLYPLLRRAVNFHLHFATKDKDGTIHLPPTYSPEYNFASGPDCNFDLALFRWGCQSLLQASERLHIADPLSSKWKDVLDNLVDYPADENGYMIAKDVPFKYAHRHFSHLLMLYPLRLVHAGQPGAKELAFKSVKHWQNLGAIKGFKGYSWTVASLISSAFGRGNEALQYLNGLKRFLQPNTLYKESGPVIETPLSGAQCIHEMAVQSWGHVIRIFPAVPGAWPDMAFHDLRTEGAFLVSAVRKEGKTQFVRIRSLAGEPCKIQPGLEGNIRTAGKRKFDLAEVNAGIFALDIRKDEEVILWGGDKMPHFTVEPVSPEHGNDNSFGLR